MSTHDSLKLAQRHIDQLVEVLGELLDVPELKCFDPDELLQSTCEVMAKARTVRSGVLDELAPLHAEYNQKEYDYGR